MRQKCHGSEKTRLAIVDNGLTKVSQPLDLCINRVFRVRIHHPYEMWTSAKNHMLKEGNRVCKAIYMEV